MIFWVSIVIGKSAFACVITWDMASHKASQQDEISFLFFHTVEDATSPTNDRTLESWKECFEARAS